MYLVDAPPPSSFSQGICRAAGQTLCVSTRPLVPGEALYRIHRQSLNTHRGKHRSGGAQLDIEAWEPPQFRKKSPLPKGPKDCQKNKAREAISKCSNHTNRKSLVIWNRGAQSQEFPPNRCPGSSNRTFKSRDLWFEPLFKSPLESQCQFLIQQVRTMSFSEVVHTVSNR